MNKIKITTNRGFLFQEIEAHVFGTWAAHRAWDGWSVGNDEWAVSDTKSGLKAFDGLTEDEAIECARRLSTAVEAPVVVGTLSDVLNGNHTYEAVDPFEFRYQCEAVLAEVLGS